MDDRIRREAKIASQSEIFQALGYAALKARALGSKSGEIIRIGSREVVVAEDEEGDGIVVQIIENRQCIEDLAFSRAGEIGIAFGSDHEEREWRASFIEELRSILEKWQGIEMRVGPGENLTFEKAIQRKRMI
jgi:hypothetical protein